MCSLVILVYAKEKERLSKTNMGVKTAMPTEPIIESQCENRTVPIKKLKRIVWLKMNKEKTAIIITIDNATKKSM